jgi:hypothetical protein
MPKMLEPRRLAIPMREEKRTQRLYKRKSRGRRLRRRVVMVQVLALVLEAAVAGAVEVIRRDSDSAIRFLSWFQCCSVIQGENDSGLSIWRLRYESVLKDGVETLPLWSGCSAFAPFRHVTNCVKWVYWGILYICILFHYLGTSNPNPRK